MKSSFVQEDTHLLLFYIDKSQNNIGTLMCFFNFTLPSIMIFIFIKDNTQQVQVE